MQGCTCQEERDLSLLHAKAEMRAALGRDVTWLVLCMHFMARACLRMQLGTPLAPALDCCSRSGAFSCRLVCPLLCGYYMYMMPTWMREIWAMAEDGPACCTSRA